MLGAQAAQAVPHLPTQPSGACTPPTPCSVHARENEGVVAAVLEEAAALGFRLADPFPSWHRRGVPGLVEGAEKLVRVDPEEDGTDGFFVALFVRDGAGGEQQQEQEQQQQQQQRKKKKKKQKSIA